MDNMWLDLEWDVADYLLRHFDGMEIYIAEYAITIDPELFNAMGTSYEAAKLEEIIHEVAEGIGAHYGAVAEILTPEFLERVLNRKSLRV
jgi:hypothetical protein